MGLDKSNVTMTAIITTPPELILRFWFTEGGVAITNQGVGVGPGSAARDTLVGQEEGNLLEPGRFRPDNIIIATPSFLPMDLV